MKEKIKDRNKARYMCKTLYFFIITIFLFSVAIYPTSAQAFTYSDSIDHYSFVLPNNWEEIPKDVIDAFADELIRLTQGQSFNYTAGFQLSDTEYYFEYPYIVVQEHDINTPSYSEIKKMFNNDEFEQLMGETLEDYSEIIRNASIGEPLIDKEHNVIFINIQLDVAEIGAVDGLAALFLGKRGITQLNFYAIKNEYSRWLPVFNSIIDSFQYDIGYAYNPAKAAQYDSPSIFEGMIERGIGSALGWGFILLIIGLFFGLKNWLQKIWKKNKKE